MLSFSSVAEAYRPDPPSPAGVNFFLTSNQTGHFRRFISLHRRPQDRRKALGLTLVRISPKLAGIGPWNIKFILKKLVRAQYSNSEMKQAHFEAGFEVGKCPTGLEKAPVGTGLFLFVIDTTGGGGHRLLRLYLM